jgi:peroxiredoxin
MLPDGNGAFSQALGLEVRPDRRRPGTRGKRAPIVASGVVTSAEIEPAKGVEVTGAEACLARL